VDDLARAVVHLMRTYSAEEPVNVGCGEDVTIRELAGLVAEVVGFRGRVVFDTSRPDGTPRKLLDVSHITALGWRPQVPLREGLVRTVGWFRGPGVSGFQDVQDYRLSEAAGDRPEILPILQT
jgi:GDP-L-fucose synthase